MAMTDDNKQQLFIIVRRALEDHSVVRVERVIRDCNNGKLDGDIVTRENLHLFRQYRNSCSGEPSQLIWDAQQVAPARNRRDVPMISTRDVVQVYSGRPGCGCGCRGKYYTDARNITRITNIVNDALTQHGTIDERKGDGVLRVGMRDGIAYFETANHPVGERESGRYYWVYTKGAKHV